MGSDRRNFLVAAISGMGALITAALTLPAVVYLFPSLRKQAKWGGAQTAPRPRPAASDWVDAAAIASLPLGKPQEVVFRRRRADGWKVIDQKLSAWVVRPSEEEVYALSPACTHLGCAVSWSSERSHFLCPCHTSAFAIDGRVLSGPAPRALDRLPARVVNGRLQLGVAQPAES